MKVIRKLLAIHVLALVVSPAHAATTDFTFDKVWSDATTSTVALTLDNYTGAGVDTFSPDDPSSTLLDVEVDAYGQAFHMLDDVAFPLSPVMQLLDGALVELDFQFNNENNDSLAAALSPSENGVAYNPYGSSIIAP